ERQKRFAGQTKYPLRRMIKFALDAITGFSVRPLRTAVHFGILFGLGALAMLAYTICAWLMGRTIEGWTSLMTIVLLLGSVQLLGRGVFGEYLGRLYLESKRRPLFVVDRITRAGLTAQTDVAGAADAHVHSPERAVRDA